jgi:hypothetical protein
MKKYTVYLHETLTHRIVVEAENESDAISMANDLRSDNTVYAVEIIETECREEGL